MMKNTLLIFLLQFALFVSAQNEKFQMRAVWVATVANIDWPSQPNLSVAQQQSEMTEMLDRFQQLNINTIVFQIRPAADAFYASSYEPWSVWLNGCNVQPDPYYDPLDFLIQEAHCRCMEVHAWLNPYRMSLGDTARLCQEHPLYKYKELVKKYGTRYYFDPGKDETRAYLNKIVADIVKHYDVDAIHLDDYFYPYKIANLKFPDDDTFKANPRGFSQEQRDDWRRNNVNMIIAELHKTIKEIKPWVQFGISPFGVWRNYKTDKRGSLTNAGTTNYDDLYADVRLWLENGTIDYVVPQLYWEIGKEVADYKVLVDWWGKNSFDRNFYVGLFASGLKLNKSVAWNKGNEIARQMALNKKYPQQEGVFFYSARPLLKNPLGICDTLKRNYFKNPSLVPPLHGEKNVNKQVPQNLRILKSESESMLIWNADCENVGERVSYYVIYAFRKGENKNYDCSSNIIGKSETNMFLLPDKYKTDEYDFAVTSIDRYRMESEAAELVTNF